MGPTSRLRIQPGYRGNLGTSQSQHTWGWKRPQRKSLSSSLPWAVSPPRVHHRSSKDLHCLQQEGNPPMGTVPRGRGGARWDGDIGTERGVPAASVPHFSLPVRRLGLPGDCSVRPWRSPKKGKERVNVALSVTAWGSAGGWGGGGGRGRGSLLFLAVRGPAGSRLCRAGCDRAGAGAAGRYGPGTEGPCRREGLRCPGAGAGGAGQGAALSFVPSALFSLSPLLFSSLPVSLFNLLHLLIPSPLFPFSLFFPFLSPPAPLPS